MLIFATVTMLCLLHVDHAAAGIVDPCNSTATSAGGFIVTCPEGDGTSLAEAGATISITVLDQSGLPIPGIPAADFWLIGCNDRLALCGGAGSSNADSTTNALGQTTMSQTIFAGGADTGLLVVVQGTLILDGDGCTVACLPITVRSVDLNSDLVVDSADEAIFGAAYTSPPNAYVAERDFDDNGVIDLADLVILHRHSKAPGHSCF
jgi:hypothetical protein